MSTHLESVPLAFGSSLDQTKMDVCPALWGLAILEVTQRYCSVTLQLVQFYLVCQCGLPSTVPTDKLSWQETCAHLIQGANKGPKVPEQVNNIILSLFPHQTLAILRILGDYTGECCRLGHSYQPAGASPVGLLDPQAHCLLPPHVTLVAPEVSAGRTLGLSLCGCYSGFLARTLYSQQVVCFICRKEKQRALKTVIHPCPPQPVTQPLGLAQRRNCTCPRNEQALSLYSTSSTCSPGTAPAPGMNKLSPCTPPPPRALLELYVPQE